MKNFSINEKDGGFIVSLDITQSDQEEVAKLIASGRQSFQVVLIPMDYIED